MAEKQKAEKPAKEKKVLTEEEKLANTKKRISDNLAVIKLALKQKDEADRDLILQKAGKVPQSAIDEAVANGDFTKKMAEKAKELNLIGAVRVVGGKGKSDARPWRYQIDTDKEGPTGKALTAIETDLKAFEDKHKENLALVSKWYLDNTGTSKTFATYFAKVAPPKETTADGEQSSK